MRIWGAAVIFLFGMLLFAGFSVYTFERQNNLNERLCNVSVETRESLRGTWLAVGRIFAEADPDITPEERERIDTFVATVLLPIPPLECEGNRPVRKE